MKNLRLSAFRYAALLALFACGAISETTAAVRLPNVFGNHMVLQRDKPVTIWGWAAPGEKITLTFAGQSKTATASKAGQWTVRLDRLKTSLDGQETDRCPLCLVQSSAWLSDERA
jgi:sialate O-acetylesterase